MFLPHFVSVFLETGCLEQNASLPLLHTEFHMPLLSLLGVFFMLPCANNM